MPTTYPARPTVYNGIEMRSRLEATFAGFLDEVGFEWTYEPRAYGSGRAQYLPDFEVTFNGIDPIFFEVKGVVEVRRDILGILRRMEIIRRSVPDARLAFIEAASLGRGYYSFGLLDPLWPTDWALKPWGSGRFAKCRCGTVYVVAVPVRGIPVPVEACSVCGTSDVAAWLDPTSRRA